MSAAAPPAETTVVVVGAGPAGLSAAVAARTHGARVVLLDASDQLGGQYWRHLPAVRAGAAEHRLHHDFQRYRGLVGGLAGVEVLTGAQVWAIEPGPAGPELQVVLGEPDGTRRRRLSLRPDALVLATGAHDRTLPFPGWDLPGVVTGGAAQALAKGERVAIGERVIVSGTGPFLLPVATSLLQTGAEVVGVYEANRPRRLAAGWLPRPWELIATTGKAAELAGYLTSLARRSVPYSVGRAVVAAHGTDRVEAVTLARLTPDWTPVPGSARRIAADAVCVSHGFTPRLELAIAAGCRLTADPSGPPSDRFVAVDDRQATSVAGVYAAGEITGIAGADAAAAEGEVAGACAAGADPPDAAVRMRRTYASFAARLAAAHPIGYGWTSWLDDDTLVCRCEEVSYGRLRRTSNQTSSVGLRSLTLTTRATLGSCQGRICGRTIEDLLSRCTGGLADAVLTDRRPIAGLIRVGELAAPPTATLPDPQHPTPSDLQPTEPTT